MKNSWDDIDVWTQAKMIAYNQIREIEDYKKDASLVGVRI